MHSIPTSDAWEALHEYMQAGAHHPDLWVDVMESAGGLVEAEDAELRRIYAQLEAVHGQTKARIAELRKAVNAERRHAAKVARVVDIRTGEDATGAAHATLTGALSVAGMPDAPSGMPIPRGYAVVDAEGGPEVVESTNEGPRPLIAGLIAVVGVAEDQETGVEHLVIGWSAAGRWRTRAVASSALADRVAFGRLRDHGCPIPPRRVAECQQWLYDQLAAARSAGVMPERVAMRRMGWTTEGDGFAWGRTGIGRDIDIMPPGAGEERHLRAYRQAGTLEGWLREVWEPLRDHAGSVAVIAAVASPLLRVLDVHGFTLDIGGESGTGKTTVQRAGASCWGLDTEVMTPWPKTWPAVREAMVFRTGIGVFLDDTKRVPAGSSIIADAVYAVADAQSQSKGSPGGGTQANSDVQVVMVSSGEFSIVQLVGPSSPGAAARCLPMVDAPLPPEDGARVARIEAGMAAHYGHVGPMVVRWLMASPEEHDKIRAAYRAEVDRARTTTTGSGNRTAAYVAVLRVAGRVLERAVPGLRVSASVMDAIGRWVTETGDDRDIPRAALLYVMGWWQQRQGRVVGASESATPAGVALIGYEQRAYNGKMQRIGWFEGALREALEDGRFVPEQVLTGWRARGWLVASKPTVFTGRWTTGNRPRLVILNEAAMAIAEAE